MKLTKSLWNVLTEDKTIKTKQHRQTCLNIRATVMSLQIERKILHQSDLTQTVETYWLIIFPHHKIWISKTQQLIMSRKSKYSDVYIRTWIDAATYASLDILHLDEEYNTFHLKKKFPCHCSGKRPLLHSETLRAVFFVPHGGFMHQWLDLNLHVCLGLWLYSFRSGS